MKKVYSFFKKPKLLSTPNLETNHRVIEETMRTPLPFIKRLLATISVRRLPLAEKLWFASLVLCLALGMADALQNDGVVQTDAVKLAKWQSQEEIVAQGLPLKP